MPKPAAPDPEPSADTIRAAAAAFSRKAEVYDSFGEDHPNLDRMRSRVRTHVLTFVRPGMKMIELNAGTGADAIFFANQGIEVLATDISPGMLAVIRKKIAAHALEERVAVRECSFTELDRLETEGPYDHIFSNMGGLNCIPDLAAVTRHLPGLLRPGGKATFVIMPPVCPWEWLAVLKGDFRTAVRRLQSGGVVANVEGVQIQTWYFSPARAQAAFGPGFSRARLENLSLFTPPADHKTFARRLPALYRLLASIDDNLSRAPVLRGWGDFYILTMRYDP